MKQVLQNISSGETILADVPSPRARSGDVLISTSASLVSAGTERMLIDFGKAGWLQKARQQPDKVKMVIDKVKTDGLSATVDAVRSKLDQPLPLGYCNVGRVISAPGTEFVKGERVVSNGHHAEVVRVPKNLCVKVPENVTDEAAAFTVIGAVALQGVRLVAPSVGETIVVTGLGLIGILAVQILIASGCRVIGIDFDSKKCALARKFGAEVIDLSKGTDAVDQAIAYSRGRGVDGVVITASSKSNEPISQAAKMCRKRGRIVLVGVVGLDLSRADFFEKELTFQVSCSYGPGRYDPNYEAKGLDYPVGFVRWTEQRNFEAVLDLMSSGAIKLEPLISQRFMIDDAMDAYTALENKSTLGILLKYNSVTNNLDTNVQLSATPPRATSNVVIGCLGAGNYASRVLIPAFRSTKAKLATLVTSGGVSATHHGMKNGFSIASTDTGSVFNDENINTVIVATQHNQHADQVVAALKNGKNVFVEKPLALTKKDIKRIENAYARQNGSCRLMVGYNRRFSPHIVQMKKLLASVNTPKTLIMTMNAGEIPEDHWTQDPTVGGGRILGEACHYIDLMRHLVGRKIISYNAMSMGKNDSYKITEDKATVTLAFDDGSFGSIHYFANGSRAFPKERIEIFADGAVLHLDNFKKLRGYGWRGFNKLNLWKQNKGQAECVKAFVDAIESGASAPIEYDEIIEVANISIDIAESLRS